MVKANFRPIKPSIEDRVDALESKFNALSNILATHGTRIKLIEARGERVDLEARINGAIKALEAMVR